MWNYIKNKFIDYPVADKNFWKALGQADTWNLKSWRPTDVLSSGQNWRNMGDAAANAAIAIPTNTVAGILNLPTFVTNAAISPFTDYRFQNAVPYYTGRNFFGSEQGVADDAVFLGDVYGAVRAAPKVMEGTTNLMQRGAQGIVAAGNAAKLKMMKPPTTPAPTPAQPGQPATIPVNTTPKPAPRPQAPTYSNIRPTGVEKATPTRTQQVMANAGRTAGALAKWQVMENTVTEPFKQAQQEKQQAQPPQTTAADYRQYIPYAIGGAGILAASMMFGRRRKKKRQRV